MHANVIIIKFARKTVSCMKATQILAAIFKLTLDLTIDTYYV